jgi:hypothetical protein
MGLYAAFLGEDLSKIPRLRFNLIIAIESPNSVLPVPTDLWARNWIFRLNNRA